MAYCIAPWTSLYVQHDGKVFPCCHWTRFQSLALGDLHRQTPEEIWNSTETKNLRLQMLEGRPPVACEDCRFCEASGRKSLRHEYLRLQEKHLHRAQETAVDGSLAEFSPVFLSLAVGIQCQLRCRTCGPSDSSAWQAVLPGKKSEGTIAQPPLAAKLEKILAEGEELERMLFVGGEPLINPLHYHALEALLAKKGARLPELFYNSNLFQLSWKHGHIFEYWKRFPKVTVYASIDGHGEKFNFLRTGHDWKRLLDNIREIRSQTTNVQLIAFVTVSLYNFLFIPELIEALKTECGFSFEEITFNFVKEPDYANCRNAPAELKKRAKAKYLSYVLQLYSENEPKSVLRLISGLRLIIDYFEFEKDRPEAFEKFHRFNQKYQSHSKTVRFEKEFQELLVNNGNLGEELAHSGGFEPPTT